MIQEYCNLIGWQPWPILTYPAKIDVSKLFFIKQNKKSQTSSSSGTVFSGYHYCTTSFNKAWIQVMCKFKSCSWHERDLWWWGSLTMVLTGNKAIKYLSSVNDILKIIHHHHHHHHHHLSLRFGRLKNIAIWLVDSIWSCQILTIPHLKWCNQLFFFHKTECPWK